MDIPANMSGVDHNAHNAGGGRHPPADRRDPGHGGQRRLQRRGDRRRGQHGHCLAAARLQLQALHLPGVLPAGLHARHPHHGCAHGLSQPARAALRAGELRPQVPRPAVGPLRAGPLLQHPGRLADGPGGRQGRHRPGPQAGHQHPGQGVLRPEPDPGRRRGAAAGHGLRQQRLRQPGRDGRPAGARGPAASRLSHPGSGQHPAGA